LRALKADMPRLSARTQSDEMAALLQGAFHWPGARWTLAVRQPRFGVDVARGKMHPDLGPVSVATIPVSPRISSRLLNEARDRVPSRMSRRKLKVTVCAPDARFLCAVTPFRTGNQVDYKQIIKWKLTSSSHNFPLATHSVAILGRKKVMKNLQNSDELIELGAISVETRGIEPVGPRDEDTNQHYLFVGGITTDD
jgi:hypothetical protein